MVTELFTLRAAGWSTGRLARRYGVQRATICYALKGRTWSHVRPAAPLPCPALPWPENAHERLQTSPTLILPN
jgi:hypothetical protein